MPGRYSSTKRAAVGNALSSTDWVNHRVRKNETDKNALFGTVFGSLGHIGSLLEVKLTPQMKYMNSREAYELLTADPDILFIDVRDQLEIALYGHPSLIDAVVAVRSQSTTFDEKLLEWELKDNPDFLTHMGETLELFGKTKQDMIIITCGSGWRSAYAARLLHEAGYSDVWHIPDGFEGEHKPGINLANAWQLEGLPWSYEQVPGLEWMRVVR